MNSGIRPQYVWSLPISKTEAFTDRAKFFGIERNTEAFNQLDLQTLSEMRTSGSRASNVGAKDNKVI